MDPILLGSSPDFFEIDKTFCKSVKIASDSQNDSLFLTSDRGFLYKFGLSNSIDQVNTFRKHVVLNFSCINTLE